MKSANWISAIGSKPCSAIPIATPTMPDSARGVSITRSSPNSSSQPSEIRNTPPRIADVFAHEDDPLVVRHLVVERVADGRHHVLLGHGCSSWKTWRSADVGIGIGGVPSGSDRLFDLLLRLRPQRLVLLIVQEIVLPQVPSELDHRILALASSTSSRVR